MAGRDGPEAARALRRAGARRARAATLAGLALLLAAGAAAPLLPLERLLGRPGAQLDWMTALLAEADFEALSREPAFELRTRFRAKVAECTGVTAASRPLRLVEAPGRLRLMAEGTARPILEVSFFDLHREGLLGDWSRAQAAEGAPPGAARAVLAAGILGMIAPGRPCPPPSVG